MRILPIVPPITDFFLFSHTECVIDWKLLVLILHLVVTVGVTFVPMSAIFIPCVQKVFIEAKKWFWFYRLITYISSGSKNIAEGVRTVEEHVECMKGVVFSTVIGWVTRSGWSAFKTILSKLIIKLPFLSITKHLGGINNTSHVILDKSDMCLSIGDHVIFSQLFRVEV